MAFTLCLAEQERLAEPLETFIYLYDKTTKGHKQKDVVADAWSKVAEFLFFLCVF